MAGGAEGVARGVHGLPAGDEANAGTGLGGSFFMMLNTQERTLLRALALALLAALVLMNAQQRPAAKASGAGVGSVRGVVSDWTQLPSVEVQP